MNSAISIILMDLGLFFAFLLLGNWITKGLLINIISLKIKKSNRVMVIVKGLTRRKSVIGKVIKERLHFKFNKKKFTFKVKEDDFYNDYGVSCIDVDEFENIIDHKGIAHKGSNHEVYENIIEEAATSSKGFDKTQKLLFYGIIGLGIIAIISLILIFQMYGIVKTLPSVTGAVI